MLNNHTYRLAQGITGNKSAFSRINQNKSSAFIISTQPTPLIQTAGLTSPGKRNGFYFYLFFYSLFCKIWIGLINIFTDLLGGINIILPLFALIKCFQKIG